MGAGVGVTARSAVVVRRQLAGLEAENRLWRRQVAIDADRVAGLEADNARLTAQVQRLRGRLEASRREGKRQAAPFSPDTKQPNPKRPGRRPGGAYGTKARRDRPTDDRVEESVAVGLPACCPDCDGAVVFDEMREQFQRSWCRRTVGCAARRSRGPLRRLCRRRVRGRHPEQTSDALGPAGGDAGPAGARVGGVAARRV